MRLPVAPGAIRLHLDSIDADLDRSLDDVRADLARPGGRVRTSRALVEAALDDGLPHYGINTGFGSLKSERIGAEDLATLQVNLVRSHAVGVGRPVPRDISRRMMQLKAHALGLGFSGVSVHVVQRLLDMLALDLIPVIPEKGSLGASGDLAPLAHMALPLIGDGQLWTDAGPSNTAPVLSRHDMAPIELGPKDGLALINGTQFMVAYGADLAVRGRRLADTADLVAAMSLEAVRGSAHPFDAHVHAIRPHAGAVAVAERVRGFLAGSEIGPSHADCDKVQDPYSIRCVPQVHGASRDALAYAASVVETEINSVTDNPLVFSGADGSPDIVSAGHFHGQPLALASDFAAIALAELASISERRSYLLTDAHDLLPPFLMERAGLQSGFMMVQYTAAALVSENKTLCHPASVDSIPSSRGQEDHVSMGAWGARKALMVLENAEQVVAAELLCAAQGLDFRRPMRAGRGVEAAHAAVRARVAFRDDDGPFEADLAACLDLVRSGAVLAAAEGA